MDLRHDIDDLFEGEPDEFDIKKELTENDLLSDFDSASTSVNPFRRTVSEELSDLQGGSVPFCAWDDYVELKQSETNSQETRPPRDLMVKYDHVARNVKMSEDYGLSDLIRPRTIEPSDGTTNCETTKEKQSIRNSELATSDAVNTSHTDQYRGNPAIARAPTVHNWKISACPFSDLLERASTPSELELEQMDFRLHKVLEQIDSVYLRQELHKVDPTLSKQKLFRLYRHAMKMMQDSDDEDEHQKMDAQRFSIFAGDPGDYEKVGLEDSSSSKDNSRNILKDEAMQQSEGNQHKIQENSTPSSSDAIAQRSRSSLLHLKPYLNDISPNDIEGHFPTTIARLPQRSKSRTNSLASETRVGRKTTPLESANEQPDVSTHDDSATPGYARTSAQSQLLPAPLFHSVEGRDSSSGRSSPLRPSAVSPAASVYAVAGSPAPDPASISRLDFSSQRYMSEDESMEDITPYSSDTSPVPSRGIRPSPLKTEHRTSDPFVAGADEISFPSTSTYSPPLSPLLDFAGQIYQPVRQSVRKRGATDACENKGKRPASRAVSAGSPSKARVSARNKVEPAQRKRAKSAALGVQGDNVKVKKNRAISRKASSRATRSNKVQHDDAEENPRVPSLPMDMDVDLPLPELRLSLPADEVTPQEAEGGKPFDESQRSPSNGNTKTTVKTRSKAKPQQRTNIRKSNNRDKEDEGSSPMEYSAARSSLTGPSPSLTPRKASTRGLAVRKTRASARRNAAEQQLDEPKLETTSQISSPKAISQPAAAGKRIPTPTKKSTRPATPASGKTDSTVDISPKMPARSRKAKPAAGGIEGKPDVGNAADADRGKVTPTSRGKRTNGLVVPGTPARRSPRIAGLRATT